MPRLVIGVRTQLNASTWRVWITNQIENIKQTVSIMTKNQIHFIEQNIHGAWVIYGILGIRQYYYYTKNQAIQQYREECNKTIFTNK